MTEFEFTVNAAEPFNVSVRMEVDTVAQSGSMYGESVFFDDFCLSIVEDIAGT